jgi:hypothetical protein
VNNARMCADDVVGRADRTRAASTVGRANGAWSTISMRSCRRGQRECAGARLGCPH